jgi:Flp pilus assembly protein TadG
MCDIKTDAGKGAKWDNAGVAAIEFAIFIPVLAIFLMGVAELGFGIYQATQVYASVDAGMLYATQNGYNSAGISNAVVNATGLTGITATSSNPCGCPGTTSVTTVSCSSTCSNGNTPGTYIQINGSLVRQSILAFPGLPLPSTLTATSLIRTN